MAWRDTSPEVYQAIKLQKAVLNRLTPNRAAAAEIIGVWPSTVEGWTNVQTMNPNFPLALVSRHPEARELLEHHAHMIGYTLVPITSDKGEVDDELLSCVSDLGQISQKVQSSLKDLHSPGRVDGREAREILITVRQLQTDITRMVSELDGIIEEELR